MTEIREYLVRFQDPDDEADVDVELTAESGGEAIEIARSLPRFAELSGWRVTAVGITPPAPACNVLAIYRDASQTPTDPYYSAAPTGASCPR
jgi:hypothetical protein